jgi:hypothetical protein
MSIFSRSFWLTSSGLLRVRIWVALVGFLVLVISALVMWHFAVPYHGPELP